MVAALAAATSACAAPLGVGMSVTTQVDAYARRSIQIMTLAAARNSQALKSLISPDAAFSLGAGDVGRPLGQGVQGALAMAEDLKPATYSFHGFGGIPMQRDPCAPQEVTVEFIAADGQNSAPIDFKYDQGVLRSASGWWTPYSSGRVQLERH